MFINYLSDNTAINGKNIEICTAISVWEFPEEKEDYNRQEQ